MLLLANSGLRSLQKKGFFDNKGPAEIVQAITDALGLPLEPGLKKPAHQADPSLRESLLRSSAHAFSKAGKIREAITTWEELEGTAYVSSGADLAKSFSRQGILDPLERIVELSVATLGGLQAEENEQPITMIQEMYDFLKVAHQHGIHNSSLEQLITEDVQGSINMVDDIVVRSRRILQNHDEILESIDILGEELQVLALFFDATYASPVSPASEYRIEAFLTYKAAVTTLLLARPVQEIAQLTALEYILNTLPSVAPFAHEYPEFFDEAIPQIIKSLIEPLEDSEECADLKKLYALRCEVAPLIGRLIPVIGTIASYYPSHNPMLLVGAVQGALSILYRWGIEQTAGNHQSPIEEHALSGAVADTPTLLAKEMQMEFSPLFIPILVELGLRTQSSIAFQLIEEAKLRKEAAPTPMRRYELESLSETMDLLNTEEPNLEALLSRAIVRQAQRIRLAVQTNMTENLTEQADQFVELLQKFTPLQFLSILEVHNEGPLSAALETAYLLSKFGHPQQSKKTCSLLSNFLSSYETISPLAAPIGPTQLRLLDELEIELLGTLASSGFIAEAIALFQKALGNEYTHFRREEHFEKLLKSFASGLADASPAA